MNYFNTNPPIPASVFSLCKKRVLCRGTHSQYLYFSEVQHIHCLEKSPQVAFSASPINQSCRHNTTQTYKVTVDWAVSHGKAITGIACYLYYLIIDIAGK